MALDDAPSASSVAPAMNGSEIYAIENTFAALRSASLVQSQHSIGSLPSSFRADTADFPRSFARRPVASKPFAQFFEHDHSDSE